MNTPEMLRLAVAVPALMFAGTAFEPLPARAACIFAAALEPDEEGNTDATSERYNRDRPTEWPVPEALMSDDDLLYGNAPSDSYPLSVCCWIGGICEGDDPSDPANECPGTYFCADNPAVDCGAEGDFDCTAGHCSMTIARPCHADYVNPNEDPQHEDDDCPAGEQCIGYERCMATNCEYYGCSDDPATACTDDSDCTAGICTGGGPCHNHADCPPGLCNDAVTLCYVREDCPGAFPTCNGARTCTGGATCDPVACVDTALCELTDLSTCEGRGGFWVAGAAQCEPPGTPPGENVCTEGSCCYLDGVAGWVCNDQQYDRIETCATANQSRFIPGAECVDDPCRPLRPQPAPYPHDRPKNRYLSFDPNKAGNDGLNTAFRVTLTALILGSCDGTGIPDVEGWPCRTDDDCRACSVDENPCWTAAGHCLPGQTCDLTGAQCVNDQAGSVDMSWWVGPQHPTTGVHLMVTQPFRRVSDDWPEVVHVADCEIVPAATYEVVAVDVDTALESDELEVSTISQPEPRYWADCVGSYDGAIWGPPDGVVGANDLLAAIHTYAGLPGLCTADVTWVDLHGDGAGDAMVDPPNYLVNFSDVGYVVRGLEGWPYPFSDPAECPDVGGWPAARGATENLFGAGSDVNWGMYGGLWEGRTAADLPQRRSSDASSDATDRWPPEIAWVPVASTGPHAIIGNEIVIPAGGAEVTLEIRISGWAPDQIIAFQASLDASSLLGSNAVPPNPGADLASISGAHGDADGVFVVMNTCHTAAFEDTGQPCNVFGPLDPACPPEAPHCMGNPDFVFAESSTAVYASPLDFTWLGVSGGCATDDGITDYYAGTLILEVPPDAEGTYTIAFDADPRRTFLNDCACVPIAATVLTPAQLTIRTGAPRPAAYPHNRAKNRYISFDSNKAANDGYDTAFKVTLNALVLGSCDDNGAPDVEGWGCRTDDDCRACSGSGDPCWTAPLHCAAGETCDPTGAQCVNDQAGSVGLDWWVGPAEATVCSRSGIPCTIGGDPCGRCYSGVTPTARACTADSHCVPGDTCVAQADESCESIHRMVSYAEREVSQDWPDTVHVGDCEIVPVAIYGVRAVDDPTGMESAELEVSTTARPGFAYWADCVAPLGDYCTGNWRPCGNDADCGFCYDWTLGPTDPNNGSSLTPCVTDADCPVPGEYCGSSCLIQWAPPDGLVNFSGDITATVVSFSGDPAATLADVMWVDMRGNTCGDSGSRAYDVPNYTVNPADLYQIVQALAGFPYPFSDPGDCPVVEPVCGNTVLEAGEECDDGNTAAGDGCSAYCQFEGTGDNKIEWLPVGVSAGPFEIAGNEIVIPQGGVQVTFEVRLSAWDADLDGSPALALYQASLDESSLLGVNANPPSPGVDLTPIIGAHGYADGAFIVMKTCYTAGLVDTGQPCDVFGPSDPACPPAAPLCLQNPAFVFHDGLQAFHTSTTMGNYTWEASGSVCKADGGDSYYAGTFIVDVPPTAGGTYTIGGDPNPKLTSLNGCSGCRLPALTLTPAQLSIRPLPPLPASYPDNRRKNRYISFDPNKAANDGLNVAFQVTLKTLELGSCSASGAPCSLYRQECSLSGGDCRSDDDCPGGETCIARDCGVCSSTGTPCVNARKDCENVPPNQTCNLTGEGCVNDWAGSAGLSWWVGPRHLVNPVHLLVSETYRVVSDDWPDVVHVADCEIVPVATYGVRAVNVNNDTMSDELEVRTIDKPHNASWADGVGALDCYCTGNWRPCEACDPPVLDDPECGVCYNWNALPVGDPNNASSLTPCASDADCPDPEEFCGTDCIRQWPPPDGYTNYNDVPAAVWLFQEAPGLIMAEIMCLDMRVNVDAATSPPDYDVNFDDIDDINGQFQAGWPYEYAEPAECPDDGTWP